MQGPLRITTRMANGRLAQEYMDYMTGISRTEIHSQCSPKFIEFYNYVMIVLISVVISLIFWIVGRLV
jgi:hypothetical protein